MVKSVHKSYLIYSISQWILLISILFSTITTIAMDPLQKNRVENDTPDFSNARVYQIQTNSTLIQSSLRELYASGMLDFWGTPSPLSGTEVVISSSEEETLLISALQNSTKTEVTTYPLKINDDSSSHVNYTLKIIIPNLEQLLQAEEEERYAKNPHRLRSVAGGGLTWDAYQPLQAITEWMENLVKFYPETTTLLKIGESGEGLPLLLLKISSTIPVELNSSTTQSKKETTIKKRGIFIDATTHAREWITTSVATWIIKELAVNSTSARGLLDRYDFYILPLQNPEGYLYSWEYNRLWRKSRRRFSDWMISCRGVDLNRNWGHEWGGEGSEESTCSNMFRGQAPFSEPETRAVRDYAVKEMSDGVEWLAYFSLHSYGQKWMTPWGYTNKLLPKDYREMIRVARVGARALQSVHGTEYEVGSTSDMLYLAAGGSDDWWKGEMGVKYAYTLELRGGLWGFLLPASQISATVEETWIGIATALRAMQ